MITFEEFTQVVMEGLQQLVGNGCQIRKAQSLRNNGLKRTGITAVREEGNVFPVIYLEQFYNDYKFEDCTINEIVEKVHALLEQHSGKTLDEFNVDDFQDWDKTKTHVFAKLINAKMNKELLEDVPHRILMDLAEVFYVKVYGNQMEGFGTILIRNEHKAFWKVDVATLHETALANMDSDETEFTSMENLLGHSSEELEFEGSGMYILTNSSKIFGASELLKKDILHNIAEKLQDNLIILPSSTHELIILSEKDAPSEEKAADMVKEINATCLAPNEVLSNHVYRYERLTQAVSIAA
ncbi:MAG: DUF5688 family protein [Agathobacter sp.]|nr:DUF5688 family protein [Agathobacter sp.]